MRIRRQAEDAERGYLITGDPQILDAHAAALRNVPVQVGEVRALTQDNPAQQQRLDRLERLIEQRLGLLAEVIKSRKEGTFEPARSFRDCLQ